MCCCLNLQVSGTVLQQLACVAAALQHKLSMGKCNVGIISKSWHVLECRRQLLERVQGVWPSAQPGRRGPSHTATKPVHVEVVQLILDTLKREKACL